MNISISPYTLNFAAGSPRAAREGALLRFDFGYDAIGYADCHPWPEAGDAPLSEQLALLSKNKLTSLTRRSLTYAMIDANARKRKDSVFDHLTIPESHYLVVDLDEDKTSEVQKAAKDGFKAIKIKVGINPVNEIPLLKQWAELLRDYGCKFRLDFNCRLTESEFVDYLLKLGSAIKSIEFVEDPFSYDPQHWEFIRKKYRIALACDKESERAVNYPASCDYLIVKPAVQNAAHFYTDQLKGRKLVFTTYLDHPLGQLAAAYVAATAAKENVMLGTCGLFSHSVYQENPFNRQLSRSGTVLIPPKGTGFGYDDLLRELPWKPLV